MGKTKADNKRKNCYNRGFSLTKKMLTDTDTKNCQGSI